MSNQLWKRVQNDVVGGDVVLETPFGPRQCLYADYTASGRSVGMIERYLLRLLETYANTHTEDDTTGEVTTRRLHTAEHTIKRLLGADDTYKLVLTGAGATGALQRLQEILGVYLPPATRRAIAGEVRLDPAPVVFVGAYEHHSNLLSWRESPADVVEIALTDDGLLDLDDLERVLTLPEYQDRLRIGSFSAASNVTGIRSPVGTIAEMLHRHNALAIFDYAAAAPYTQINVRGSGQQYMDAIVFSPHKFIGGPGGAGVLLFKEDLYDVSLAPTFAGGGTVVFVGPKTHQFSNDVETREKGGTPAIVQTFKTALALELKEQLGVAAIEAREQELIGSAMKRLGSVDGLEIVGNPDPTLRLAILSFVVRFGSSYLHPRFVTRLLNDLFGIQSRAGCLCAGPYGHRILDIQEEQSEHYRHVITELGIEGVKPGWTRVNFHFLLTDEAFQFLCDAIAFVATHGVYFLQLYVFNVNSGAWLHREHTPPAAGFGLDEALALTDERPAQPATPAAVLSHARELAEHLKETFDRTAVQATDCELIPFAYIHGK